MKKTVKTKVFFKLILIGFVLHLGLLSSVSAQSTFKESNNHFARYTQDGKLDHLKEAKNFIDKTYQNKRDSNLARVNILRAMVYSSLAYSDSTRTLEYEVDPIDITQASLKKIRKRDKYSHQHELSFIQQNLASAHVYAAEKAMEESDYETAFLHFKEVNKINPDNLDVLNNLALLSYQAEEYEEAEIYSSSIINSGEYDDNHYLQLAKVYRKQGNEQAELETLKKASEEFPESKEVIFRLVEVYVQNKDYPAIAEIIDRAIEFEPENVSLNYLAGYANENQNRVNDAADYYEKVIALDENSYKGNLALGLVELKTFLNDKENQTAQYNAQEYLLKANEIKPYEVSALKSLAVLYENTGNDSQLDRVNLLLNQIDK